MKTDPSCDEENSDYIEDSELARILPYAWPAFFHSFGRNTKIQRVAIPKIFRGSHVLVTSGTASGKTEAACAPLVERHYRKRYPWTILYISPTRALVNDLYERLSGPLERLNLRLKRRTGDHRDNLSEIPHVLLTTPESFDSLLCRNKRQDNYGHDLAHVVAVVLDEIHLIHGTPRGDQIIWLLKRLKKLRKFAKEKCWTQDDQLQIIGLSATISDPQSVLDAYFPEGSQFVTGSNKREIITIAPLSGDTSVLSALPQYLSDCKDNQKVLVFSNSRKRVDNLAHSLQVKLKDLNYGVAAHHGSLDKKVREASEKNIKIKNRIVLCATSTLEIGVDIGDIDLIVLDGPPPDISSLLQRIGRGNRRTNLTRVLPCANSLRDLILQDAMIIAAQEGWLGEGYSGPSYSVIRQQIASYIFQASDKRRSKKSLQKLFCKMPPDHCIFKEIFEKMLSDRELVQRDEWIRMGEHWLKKSETMGTLHSNIQSGRGQTIIDLDSGRSIAENLIFRGGSGLHVGGKSLEVKKWDSRKIEVRNLSDSGLPDSEYSYNARSLFIHSSRPQALKRYLDIDDRIWPIISYLGRNFVFHFGGAARFAVLYLITCQDPEMLEGVMINEWYIRIPGEIKYRHNAFKNVNQGSLTRILLSKKSVLERVERILNRPSVNSHLPLNVRVDEVRKWMNLENEIETINNSEWIEFQDNDINKVLQLFLAK